MKKLIERCVLLTSKEKNYHCYYKGFDPEKDMFCYDFLEDGRFVSHDSEEYKEVKKVYCEQNIDPKVISEMLSGNLDKTTY